MNKIIFVFILIIFFGISIFIIKYLFTHYLKLNIKSNSFDKKINNFGINIEKITIFQDVLKFLSDGINWIDLILI